LNKIGDGGKRGKGRNALETVGLLKEGKKGGKTAGLKSRRR